MRVKCLITTLAGLLLIASAAFAVKVRTDYDHGASFGSYKTYSWTSVKTANSIWDDRVKDAVNSALAAKGLTEVPSGGDIAVTAVESTKNQQTLQTFYDGVGGGWRWRGFGDSTTTVENYKVGTLVVDLFDASSQKLVWRGSASDTLSDKADKNTKNLDNGVKKMFAHFPPSASK
jgi:Domain of unknown function (DUF4136)